MSRGPVTLPVVLPVRLTAEDRECLEQIARREGSTATQVARRAVRREIERVGQK